MITELEREFQKSMRDAGFHIRYNGAFTCASYDKYFKIWLVGYKAKNK